MYKLVSPRELTEIITGLLLKPELLGELDSPEKHRMFMADLGRVVAEHCGGLVNSVVLPGAEVTVPDGLPLNGQPVRVTNGAIVIHTQRLKSDPGGNLLS